MNSSCFNHSRFHEFMASSSEPAYRGPVELSGIWNVPLAQLERDRPPTWCGQHALARGRFTGVFAPTPWCPSPKLAHAPPLCPQLLRHRRRTGTTQLPVAQVRSPRLSACRYFAIGAVPGTFALEERPGGPTQTLVFTLQISLRVCCVSLEMNEVHTLEPSPEPNTWHRDLGGGRREVRLLPRVRTTHAGPTPNPYPCPTPGPRRQVLTFVSDFEALLEWWGADGRVESTRRWTHLGRAAH